MDLKNNNSSTCVIDAIDTTDTHHVHNILGDPRKSTLILSIPIVVALISGAVNNVVDLIWVSGLGVDALSAVGFCVPIHMALVGISGGLGAGGGVLISQRIGAKDKQGADSYAGHLFILMFIIAFLFSITILLFIKPILIKTGAGSLVEMSVFYARVFFSGTIIFLFNDISVAILGSEGDVRRVMKIRVFGVALNMLFDPLFIYGLHLGIVGAALATIVSGLILNVILFNRLFYKKNTFVTISYKKFQLQIKHIIHILNAGVPVLISGVSFAALVFILNIIVIKIGGTDGLAVFSIGMRVVFLSTLPMMGIATAVITLAGASTGACEYRKLREIHYAGIRLGLYIEGSIACLTWFFAPYMSRLFIWAGDTGKIENDLIIFFKIMAMTYLAAPFIRASTGIFVGCGNSFYAMIVALMRTCFVVTPMAFCCGMYLDMGITGIWVGVVAGNSIVAFVTFIWAKLYIVKQIARGAVDDQFCAIQKKPVLKTG